MSMKIIYAVAFLLVGTADTNRYFSPPGCPIVNAVPIEVWPGTNTFPPSRAAHGI